MTTRVQLPWVPVSFARTRRCWGANDNGQLGIGPSGTKFEPQLLQFDARGEFDFLHQ